LVVYAGSFQLPPLLTVLRNGVSGFCEASAAFGEVLCDAVSCVFDAGGGAVSSGIALSCDAPPQERGRL